MLLYFTRKVLNGLEHSLKDLNSADSELILLGRKVYQVVVFDNAALLFTVPGHSSGAIF